MSPTAARSRLLSRISSRPVEAERTAKNRAGQEMNENLLNLERAVAACAGEDPEAPHRKGLEMIFQQFKDLLTKEGVTEIEALGAQFDPEKHNAVMHVDSEDFGENVVAQVFQTGFMLGDKVIRHAIVQVAN